jgi:hypothetical protein
MMFFGMLISGFGMIIMGPDHYLTRLPEKPFMAFIGQIVTAIGNSLIFIPVIPDIIDSV